MNKVNQRREDAVTRKLGRIPLSDLPKPVSDKIMSCFTKCKCMDIYSGDALHYLDIIDETLRRKRKRPSVDIKVIITRREE